MAEDEQEETNIREIKAILLGNSGVGKTNLINTCVGKEFSSEKIPTNTASYSRKEFEIKGLKYEVNLWDTAGQEIYDSITKILLKKSEIVIFVYDITDIKSFESIEKWIKTSKDMIDNQFVSGLVGNKMDLYINEQVKEDDARKFAESKEMQFQLVSAKDNPQSFQLFLKDLVEELVGVSKSQTKVSLRLSDIKVDDKKKKCNC